MFSIAMKNYRDESEDRESLMMFFCMGSRFPLCAWGRSREENGDQSCPAQVWGKREGTKGVKISGKNNQMGLPWWCSV